MINDTATGESVSFLYGPDRRAWFEQTQSPSGTETTYHAGTMMDIVMAGGTTTDRDYIYAGSEPVAVDVPGSGAAGFHYFQADHQGSIAAITNPSGQVSVNESFAAFGARRNPATWSGPPTAAQLTTIAGITRRGYTFQDTLGQMGLNDMVGRVQDAITGRFLSGDPYISDTYNPQNHNRYSYVNNNPLTDTDPSGFCDVMRGCPGAGETYDGETAPLSEVSVTATRLGGGYSVTGYVPFGAGESANLNGNNDPGESAGRFGSGGRNSNSTSQPAGTQSNPPTVPNLPQVTITPGPPVPVNPPPSSSNSFVFNWFVEPWCGWVDCAGNRCSSGETAWRFVRGPVSMAGGVVTGKLLAPVTSAAGTALANAEAKTGPATALVLLMQLSPDATVAIANILNVQGAEELDQVMLLYTVEEGMSELEDVELGQFDPMRPP